MHKFKVPRVFGLTIISWYFCKMFVDNYIPWFAVVATCGFCYACLVPLLSLMWYLPVVQSANSIKSMFHLAGQLFFIWYVVYWLQIENLGNPEIVSRLWASWHDWIGREVGSWDGKSWRDSTTSSPSLPERDWSQRLFRDNRGAIGQNRDTILDCCD